jgi:hypothetical protein
VVRPTSTVIEWLGCALTVHRTWRLLLAVSVCVTAVVERAKPFGFDITFYDPYLADGVDKSMGRSPFIAACSSALLLCTSARWMPRSMA